MAASGLVSLSTINKLAAELYEDAVKQFGEMVVISKKAHHLAQVQRFLRNSPKYKLLMAQFRKLPRYLMPKGRLLPSLSGTANFPIARYMRKQFFLANLKPGLAQRMGTIAVGLNGKVRLLKGIDFGATWVLPAVLGLINVAHAPVERKMRVLFEEGVGIIGGVFGTSLGADAGCLLIAPMLCLGPFGTFVTVFICASVLGVLLSEAGKYGVDRTIDIGNNLDGRFFHSLEEMLGVF